MNALEHLLLEGDMILGGLYNFLQIAKEIKNWNK